MSHTTFSIIIPVYNVENYLTRCVKSVLCQTYKDFEIILVDDGSPDKCPEICDQLGYKDNRIQIIHKTNGGLADARNAGLTIASGDYILFLDSDDYWDNIDALSILNNRLSSNNYQTDLLLYGCKDLIYNTNKISISRGDYNPKVFCNGKGNKAEILSYLYASGQFPGSAWIVAIRRTFLIKNNIWFIKGIKSEDIDWLLEVLTKVQSIDAIKLPFYIYTRGRTGSITKTVDIKHIHDLIFILEKWSNRLLHNQNQVTQSLLSYLAYNYLITIFEYSSLKIEQQDIVRKLEKYKYLLKYALGVKGKSCAIIINILGINKGGKILHVLHHWLNR